MTREMANQIACTPRCTIVGDLVQWGLVSYLKLRDARNYAELGAIVLVGGMLGRVAQVVDRVLQFATEGR